MIVLMTQQNLMTKYGPSGAVFHHSMYPQKHRLQGIKIVASICASFYLTWLGRLIEFLLPALV